MTASEFSNEFNLLYNNLDSNQSPGLTEYEKGVVLTKAQLEILKNYTTSLPGGNKYQKGVDKSEKRFIDFSTVIGAVILNAESYDDILTTDERGKVFRLVDDSDNALKILSILTESFKTGKDENSMSSYQVIPLSSEEYERLMSRPSGEPLKNQVWRLSGSSINSKGAIEIVPRWKDKDNPINRLYLKYIKHPYPIILEDLSGTGYSIEGCVLPKYRTEPSDRFDISGIAEKDDLNIDFILTVEYQKTPVAFDISPDNVLKVGPIQYDSADNTVKVGMSFKTPARSTIVTFKNPSLQSKGLKLSDFSSGSGIILQDLDYEYSTIGAVAKVCELPEELHPEIVQRAVEIAKSAYPGELQPILTTGTRSE